MFFFFTSTKRSFSFHGFALWLRHTDLCHQFLNTQSIQQFKKSHFFPNVKSHDLYPSLIWTSTKKMRLTLKLRSIVKNIFTDVPCNSQLKSWYHPKQYLFCHLLQQHLQIQPWRRSQSSTEPQHEPSSYWLDHLQKHKTSCFNLLPVLCTRHLICFAADTYLYKCSCLISQSQLL